MASSGSITLGQYPLKLVRLACKRCPRKGQYAKAGLVQKYGSEIPLPDLRNLIANCPNQGKMSDGCGVYFVDLKPPVTS